MARLLAARAFYKTTDRGIRETKKIEMAVSCDVVTWFCIFLSLAIFLRLISWKTSKLPPGPVGLPVFGCLFQLGNMPNESLARFSRQYGPLMSIRVGMRTMVVVSSPEMAAEVLQKHDQDFAGRTVMDAVNVFDHPKFSIMTNQNCSTWRALRRVCNNELFSPKRLDAMRGLQEEKVQALLKHVRVASAAGCPIDIGQCVFSTVLNLLSSTVFSVDVVDLGSGSAGEFKSMVEEISEAAGKSNVADYFPVLKLVDPQGIRRRTRMLVKQLYGFLDELIEKRCQPQTGATAEEGRKKKGSEDFLDVLLQLADKPSSGFTRNYITPLLADLFVAATDTISVVVEWAMTELLRHPDKMAAVQTELRQTDGIRRIVQESDIPRLPYLQAVVKETLRLHPPAPLLLPHRADVTAQVAGFTIPKHTQVIVNAWAISRDTAYWEDPLSFLPERFIDSSIDFKGKNFQFIPFGAGRRMCVGMPLARRMIHFVLASLLHAFSWELPQGIEPHQLDVEAKFGITLQKAVPLSVLPSPVM